MAVPRRIVLVLKVDRAVITDFLLINARPFVVVGKRRVASIGKVIVPVEIEADQPVTQVPCILSCVVVHCEADRAAVGIVNVHRIVIVIRRVGADQLTAVVEE